MKIWAVTSKTSDGQYSGTQTRHGFNGCSPNDDVAATWTLTQPASHSQLEICNEDNCTDFFRTQCGDGVDNNADGKTDYPDDPQCSSTVDNKEGGSECSDELDNDGDGRTDFPSDLGCQNRADDSEDSNRLLRPTISGVELVEVDDDVLYQARILNTGPQVENEVELLITLSESSFGEPAPGSFDSFDGGCTVTNDVQRKVRCKVSSLAPGAEASVTILVKAAEVELRGTTVFAHALAASLSSTFEKVITRIRPACGATFEGAKVECGEGTITGTNRADILVGSDAKDTINGRGGNDWMFGLLDNDNLKGGAGSDWLIGGPGDDLFGGGKGRDHCEGDKGKEESCEDVM